MTVIQNAAQPAVERSLRTGGVQTPIGGIETDLANINVWVSGTDIDLSLVCRLEDDEARGEVAHSALHLAEAAAHIDLDDEHAEGLIELLQQALVVRAKGLAASSAERGGGTSNDERAPGRASS